ncbi:AbrB family transcriptional regulator [Rubrobacter indicoceani]|uniref:AbrB family transcriptional regulator n=1 Tax=Rubrobacter indicoceani TaxID=2051957 RepID=UPI0013C4733A|nr:AbrB family transcriptional regulator [Rubrobacter indicoceani]
MSGSETLSRGNVLRLAALAALAVPVVLLAELLSLPAAWLVGPLLAAVMLALAAPGLRPHIPRSARVAVQAVIGVVLASGFDPQTLPLIARNWLPVALAVVGTLAFSLLSGVLLSRFAGLDRRTALTGVLPGAASGMLAISESVGADPRVVAVMQYGRVILVVLSATIIARLTGDVSGAPGGPPDGTSEALLQSPPAIYLVALAIAVLGAWLGLKSRLPAGALLGPLVLGVIVVESGTVFLTPPPIIPEIAFATIGAYAGLLFDRPSVAQVARFLPWLILSNVLLMIACAALGLVLAFILETDILTAYLATTPGGLDSVTVLALESNADISLVTAIQTLRIFTVIVAGAALGRFLSKRA